MKDVRERLQRLARLQPGPTPVVSVYLNTEWVDEHQRERIRVFLKSRLREVREAGGAATADLDWVEAQSRALVERAALTDSNGVAFFACASAGLQEIVPIRVPFDDAFIVEPQPYLRPLAGAIESTPAALVVFIDGTTARLVALGAAGPEDEILLEAEVEGRHRTGGWAALAQSRYQRHIQAHRDQHVQAVAAAVTIWSVQHGAERVVLAGETRMVAALREHLPKNVGARVVGNISGARWESSAELTARAAALLAEAETAREDAAVDAVLAEAAGNGVAVAGVESTLEAVNRHAVRDLYLLERFSEPGGVCAACGVLQRHFHFTCAFCGQDLQTTELGEAMVERVLRSGGRVTTLERHAGLARQGGVAARLRYGEGPRPQ